MLVWDFVEAVSLAKSLSVQPLLPTASSAYGKISVVDNACPVVQRTFTANAVTATQVNTILTDGKTRNACFTITTSLGTEYTGRFIQMQAAQQKGSPFYQLTIVLQDTDAEVTGTTKVTFDLGEDDFTTETDDDEDDEDDDTGGTVDDGGDPVPADDADDGG